MPNDAKRHTLEQTEGNEMAQPLTDIIFDCCGVLVDCNPRLTLEGLYPPGVVDMFFDPEDEWGFDYFNAMTDIGWSQERVLAQYALHHGPAVAWMHRLYFERHKLAFAGMIPGMAELLKELHNSGITLWGLTNFTTSYLQEAMELYPELHLLQDIVVSSEEGVRKPDALIYQRAIARFGVNPSTTAFVDDSRRNVQAAERQGLIGIHFTDAVQLRSTLERFSG